MPEVYKTHDILVFVSTREEGLPLVMVEAMLAGCAVLTTGSGGAIEVAKLADLPLIPKADSVTLARRLTEFAGNPEVLYGVALRGQEVARKEFGMDVMIQRWESTIAAIKRSPVSPSGERR